MGLRRGGQDLKQGILHRGVPLAKIVVLTAQQVVTLVIKCGPTTGTGWKVGLTSEERETQPLSQTKAVGVGGNEKLEGVN